MKAITSLLGKQELPYDKLFCCVFRLAAKMFRDALCEIVVCGMTTAPIPMPAELL